jgi:DNA-binding transcriptional LysR family regulator
MDGKDARNRRLARQPSTASVYYMKSILRRAVHAAGRLVSLLQESMPLASEGFLRFYPSRRQNPAPLQAIIDFLRANLKERSVGAGRRAVRPP